MAEDKLFVDKHRGELIQRVNNTAAILAELVSENVIQQDSYDKIRALPTPQQIMRELFSGPLASSGVQGKETFYKILKKHESYLIDDLKRTEYENAMKVETISSVIELLLETLSGLSDSELEEFMSLLLSQTCIYEHFSNIQWRLLRTADMQDTVFSMVQNDGQQSVQTAKEVLEKMKRTDLVQRLSDSSSGSKKKHSVDEHLSALIHKVATMRAIKERLLETLGDLSNKELEKFKWLLQFTLFQRSLELMSWREVQWTYSVNELVDVMVENFGQQSVEVTVEVLMDMNRTDLMQKLSETISGLKAAGSSAEAFGVRTTRGEKHCMDEDCPALVQTVEMMTSVVELLLETLASLSDGKLRKFRDILLSQTDFDRCVSHIPLILLETEDRQVIVFVMVQTYGQQSVERARVVLEKMKRTDLVQRLSDSSKRPKSEHQSALIQKVATMAAVKQLLLKTLNGLSDKELKKFQWSLEWIVSQKDLPDVSPEFGLTKDRAEIVDVMLQTYSQQSVPLTREVVKKMNRIDLTQRLSKPSSELEKTHSVDEDVPAVLKKAAVKLILLETLKDLSKKEIEKFKWLLQFTQFQKGLPHVSLSGLQRADCADALVDLMVQTCGQQSVDVTMEVFMDMNRTDLVKRLSVISSRIKEKQSSELPQREVTMTPLMETLLETLEDLSEWELRDFKHVLQRSRMKKHLPKISTHRLETASRIGMLKLMVDFDGHLSVEMTREVLMKIHRRDLAERLSETSSGLKVVRQCEPLQKEVTMTPLMETLLETLEDLSEWELRDFKHVLQRSRMKKGLPKISTHRLETASRIGMLKLMVDFDGHLSVEMTREVLMKIHRRDLAERLSETSLGLKVARQCEPLQKEVTKTPLMETLLETLEDLSPGEFEKFKQALQYTNMETDIPKIISDRVETADRVELVELMVKIYGQHCVEVTSKVLKKMNSADLMVTLSEPSSGLKGPSRSLELEGCGGIMQDSSDWTEVQPEVNSTDANKASTYSLQSEAGNFECSVSGLRWVCREKVSFKYQFCSWDGPMERIESMQYMAAGPLMDLTVTAGKLDVVYLPHWICIEDNPTILDKFAVLHIDDCGDIVEKASEVTASHVKLSEPVFSPRAVLMKTGLPVKIHCNVLIYKTNTAFLTLHVYLIPCDPGLQQEMDKRHLSRGYKIIQKPHPEKSLKMRDRFILTADLDSADICPETLKLRHKHPNFFEVFIENPDKVFKLKLEQVNDHQPVWTCAVRKDDYQSRSGPLQGEHFVDKHQCELIKRVSNIGPILDDLLREMVIQQEECDAISALTTSQEKMRKLYRGALKAGGHDGKDVFYKALEENEKYLVADLKSKES